MGNIDPVQLERMAREMGMDPAALQQMRRESGAVKRSQLSRKRPCRPTSTNCSSRPVPACPVSAACRASPVCRGWAGTKGTQEMIPVLSTERLIHERLARHDDFEVFASVLDADPEATARYIGGPMPKRRCEAWRRHVALMIGHWHLRGYGFWVLQRSENHCAAGRVSADCGIPEDWPEAGSRLVGSANSHPASGLCLRGGSARCMRYARGAWLADADQPHQQGQFRLASALSPKSLGARLRARRRHSAVFRPRSTGTAPYPIRFVTFS